MKNQKTSIMMIIVKKENLWKVIQSLKNISKFIVLKSNNEQFTDFFFVIYEGDTNNIIGSPNLKFTIVHKKGRCYYTINALNELIIQKNGILDKQYLIDWEQYQNSILLLNKEKKLIKVDTKLHRIIKR